MKLRITTLIFLFTISLYSQTNEKTIGDRIDNYETEIDANDVYHNKTLNLLFNKYLESYVTSVEVPSLRSLSAVLDNDDNSFSFGYSFDPRGGKASEYLQYLLYAGLKVKGKKEDEFYTIFESDKARNNIGVEIKGTWFFPGSIFRNTNGSLKSEIKTNRETKIKRKAIEEFENEQSIGINKIDEFIAKEEADYIVKKKKYNSFSKAWATVRFYYPITDNEYDIVNNAMDFNKSQSEFKNWDASFSLNYFRHFKSAGSYTISIIPRIFNNNNILTEGIESKTFTTFGTSMNEQPIQTSTEDLYVGEFDEFTTSQLKAECTSLFLFDEKVGLSAAIEKNFGSEYDPLNWKIGVPVSLKNAKGESDINFEIQWREINKNHFIGISLGKTFGKYVK